MDIYGEAPDKMTYTEQANKRAHCKRLTWYVHSDTHHAVFNTLNIHQSFRFEESDHSRSPEPHYNFRRAIDSSPKLGRALPKLAFFSLEINDFTAFTHKHSPGKKLRNCYSSPGIFRYESLIMYSTYSLKLPNKVQRKVSNM